MLASPASAGGADRAVRAAGRGSVAASTTRLFLAHDRAVSVVPDDVRARTHVFCMRAVAESLGAIAASPAKAGFAPPRTHGTT